MSTWQTLPETSSWIPSPGRRASTIPSSTRSRTPASTAAPRRTLGSTLTWRPGVSRSTCVPRQESPPPSSAPTGRTSWSSSWSDTNITSLEPSSTSSTSSVTGEYLSWSSTDWLLYTRSGGTTLTATSNLPSTTSTSSSTRNRKHQTARLSSAKMTNGFSQVWNQTSVD